MLTTSPKTTGLLTAELNVTRAEKKFTSTVRSSLKNFESIGRVAAAQPLGFGWQILKSAWLGRENINFGH